MLVELRMLETVRQPVDLLVVRDEQPVALDQVVSELRRLVRWGRRRQYVEVPYIFTHGRVSIGEGSRHHRRKLWVDALLRAEPSQ